MAEFLWTTFSVRCPCGIIWIRRIAWFVPIEFFDGANNSYITDEETHFYFNFFSILVINGPIEYDDIWRNGHVHDLNGAQTFAGRAKSLLTVMWARKLCLV